MSNDLAIGSMSAVAKAQNKDVATVITEALVDGTAKIVCVDVSQSMGDQDAPGGMRRIDAARAELEKLQKAYPGQIILVEFSHVANFNFEGELCRPGGGTDLSTAFDLIEEYDGLADVWVITDGETNNQEECIAYVKKHASKIHTVFMGEEGNAEAFDFLKRLAKLSGGKSAKTSAPGMLAAPIMGMLPPPKGAINL